MRYSMREKVLLVSHFLAVLCVSAGPMQIQARLHSTGVATSPNLNYSVVPQPVDENVCEYNEACTAAMECSFGFEAKANLKPCSTATHVDGVCCPTSEQNETSSSNSSHLHKRSLEHPGEYLYLNAINEGQQEYNEKLRHEDKHRAAMTAKDQQESLFHRMLRPAAVRDHAHAQDPEEQSDVYGHIFASQKFAEMTNMTLEERQGDRFVRLPRAVQKRCLPPVPCNPNARYRTINGTCNNPRPDRTSWGQAGYPFDRVLSPAYEDGVWAPRIHSVTGNLLESARTISVALFPDLFRPDPTLNILFMQLGQFISHDFTLSRSITLKNGQPIECCTPDGSRELTGAQRHFACFPISVSPDDPFYSKFGVRCLNVVRIRLARGPKCKMGYAKQADLVTHFIDASVVYGSTDDVAFALRSFRQGKLRDSFPTGIELLPFARDPRDCVPWARVCYDAGDIRTNQLLALTMVHTLFMREHNRVAEELSRLNTHWDDETIYQESRRIVIAELQNVVYNEYLPILLGHRKVQQFGLEDPIKGFTNFYNPNLRPMTLAEVAVAAQRYGHSTVEGFFRLLHKKAPPEDVFIKDIFNDPTKTLEPDSFDEMMFSFNQQPMESMDNAVTFGLTRFLFKERKPFGSDLAAINMQRSRDFALRPYNDYREWAGLPRITDFRQLGKVGARLAQVYESPDDIDLWPGGVLEPPANGAVVGPTFSHLLAKAYSRYKFGDRYYFTNSPEVNPGAFTLQQLKQIRRTSLASIICANVDNRFDFYQAPQAFLQPSNDNVPVPCENYRLLRLGAWRN
ncbi:chorion peroxidase-like isoform X2 [Ochlerotatus camptorhynchus]|uniref:chorion peroxidase-like isoform X2 n=1 Tax=Ochlerotatus camptorhynchus TaxID=644619 RepID=UPI0031E02ED3